MLNVTTPGVYVRDIEVAPPAAVRLDISGFVGQAERGPLNFAQLLTSWGQFRGIFGDFVGFSYLPYAVFGFFLNGGERCYVVRVAHETAKKAQRMLDNQDNVPAISIEAMNEGVWGNALAVTVEEQSDGFQLIVWYRPGGKLVREEVEEIFDELSMNPDHERYFVRVINGDPEETDAVKRTRNGNSLLVRVEDLSPDISSDPSPPKRVEAQALENGADGPHTLSAAYYTGYANGTLFRPLPPDADAAQRTAIEAKRFGLSTFEAVEEIGLIAIPDLILPDLSAYYSNTPGVRLPKEGIIFATVPPNVPDLSQLEIGQRDMLRHCEQMGDRFAILDAPPGVEVRKGQHKIEDWPSHFQAFSNAKYGALYYPWIQEKAADFDGRKLFIPPSGHLTGIYARTEQERGIGKAPANEIVQGIVALEFAVNNAQQEILNPRGVNCLRTFPGRGLLVWGARTLSLDPLWRYVNVRRVCLLIIKQLLVNLQWTVFEPNDPQLWDKIVATLTLFFRDLFDSGALAGTAPGEAFFVKCDEETNPPEVVDRGEVITQIGFAPARPAEFILVTIRRTAGSLSVSEQGI